MVMGFSLFKSCFDTLLFYFGTKQSQKFSNTVSFFLIKIKTRLACQGGPFLAVLNFPIKLILKRNP